MSTNQARRMRGMVNIPNELGGGRLNWDDCPDSVFEPIAPAPVAPMHHAEHELRTVYKHDPAVIEVIDRMKYALGTEAFGKWCTNGPDFGVIVRVCDKDYRPGSVLNRSFTWSETPEGGSYWSRVFNMLCMEEKAHSAVEPEGAYPVSGPESRQPQPAPQQPSQKIISPMDRVAMACRGDPNRQRTMHIMHENLTEEEYYRWCEGVMDWSRRGKIVTSTTNPAEIIDHSFSWFTDTLYWYDIRCRLAGKSEQHPGGLVEVLGDDANDKIIEGVDLTKVHIQNTPTGESDDFLGTFLMDRLAGKSKIVISKTPDPLQQQVDDWLADVPKVNV